MAVFSDQHDLSGLEGVPGFLHAGGGTPAQSKGPGVWRRLRQGRSLLGRRPAQREVWLGRHNSIRLSDKGTGQSQELGWGMRVELSGFGCELGAIEESICFMEVVLQKTTLRQLYPTSLPQIDFIF